MATRALQEAGVRLMGMIFVGVLVTGLGVVQLWRAFVFGRTGAKFGDLKRASEPRLFWLAVIVWACVVVSGIGTIVLFATPTNSN
jgi:hypothetical protein